MKVHFGGRLFLAAAVLGAVALMTAGFFAALAIRSALADPGGPVPNPGHAWTELQDHGVSGSDYWLGTTDTQALELRVNGERALRLEPNADSPNVIGGHSENSVTAGAVGAAICGGGSWTATNRVTDHYGTVGGGVNNQAGDNAGTTNDRIYATVGGGWSNTASGGTATVGGGNLNNASAWMSTVGGGDKNTASGGSATVGGGDNNTASGGAATVGGGASNTASDSATVGGGYSNNASGDSATVAGGVANTASGWMSTVGGGNGSTASGWYATVAGGGRSDFPDPATGNRATDNFCTVGGGANNQAGDDAGTTDDAMSGTVGGGRSNTASGGSATVGGGNSNTASAQNATVGGGDANTASADHATVGGGSSNTASDDNATVGGGWWNTASAQYATVGGGSDNVAQGGYATVSGGWDNEASGAWATVAGGQDNTASGRSATVPGGEFNSASGTWSFAAGYRAKANNQGCFVWGDSTDTDIACNNNNRFIARASGGVYLYTNSTLTSGAYLAAGSGSWSTVSDRNLKDNFTPVDGQEVLARLADVPISTWNLKSQDASIRHMGPMAQDFSAAFGLGESDTAISTVDADGVALAAIQGLYSLSQEQDARIQALEEENGSLQQRLDGLETRVTALEGGASTSGAGAAGPFSGFTTGWLALGGLVVAAGLVLVQRRRSGGQP
jgi:hypothetical protein